MFRIVVGIIFGIAALIGIFSSSSGVPHSGLGVNSIIIPLAGLVGGIVSAGITTCILILTLLFFQGEPVSPPDILIISTSFIAGILVFLLKERKTFFKISYFEKLVLFSLLVAAISVGAVIVFPPPGSSSDLVSWFVYIPLFGLIFFGFLILGTIIQSIDTKKENKFELMAYKDHLEALVHERTFDLERTNALKIATIESTTDGIVVVDFEGKIKDFNSAADNILNLSEKSGKQDQEATISTIIKDQMPDRAPAVDLFDQVPPPAEQPVSTTLAFRSGQIYDVCLSPYRLNGEIVGRVLNFRDITETKHYEESLRNYNQKLLLLSGITRHDTLNQLTVLTGFLQMSELEETDQKKVEYIKKERAASDKIRELLDFTRDYQDLGLHEAAWQNPQVAFQKASEAFSENRILFSSGPIDGEIFADPLLVRVFYNLIDNSIRHGITNTAISLSAKTAENGLIIVYEDNGYGITPENKNKIFSRGFGKNTGLGLFLIREILSITGIDIKETGTYGKGVRFEIQVPAGKFRGRFTE